MSRRPGPIIVMCTLLLVHVVFVPVTYHVSEVKFFIFAAGVFALLAVVASDVFFGRLSLPDAFRGNLQKHVLLAVLAYLLLTAASVIWASYRTAVLFRTLEVLLYAAWAVLVAVTLKSRREISQLLSVFLLAGVLTALVAFASCPFYPQHREQFFLPMGTGNWLAACLLIPMMLCVEGFCRNVFGAVRRAGAAVLLGSAFVLMAAVLLFSESESAMAAFALSLAALPIFLRARRRWLIASMVAGVLVLACVADVALRKPSKIRSFAHSKSVVIRLTMWRWGLKLVRRNPVSGLGAGGYFPNVGTVSARDINQKPGYFADINLHAHNEPLEVLVELGVLGLLAFLIPAAVLLPAIARLPRDLVPSEARDGPDDHLRLRLGAFAAGWLALFLQSFVTVGMRFWSVPVVFWTGIGLLLASLRVLSRPEETETSRAKPLSRQAVNVGLGILVVLLVAGTYFILFRGFRASVAMKQTLSPLGGTRQMRLRKMVSEESVFFADRVRAHNALGRLYTELNRPGAAAEQFETVLKLAGDYHDTKLLLAEIHLKRRRLGDAMPLLESYGKLRPADPRTANLLSQYLAELPEAPEALEQLNRLIQTYPECSKVHVAAGKIGRRLDPPDPEAVRRHFARALELDPHDAHAAYLLAVEKLKNHRYQEARELLTRSLEGGLRAPTLYLNLSRMERMFGEADRARELLHEGLKLFPESEELRKELEEFAKTDR